MNLVNQKTIEGVTYTAYRDVQDGIVIEYVTCNGSEAQARLKEVWNDPAKLKALFEGTI
jgi:hypothetical protein